MDLCGLLCVFCWDGSEIMSLGKTMEMFDGGIGLSWMFFK